MFTKDGYGLMLKNKRLELGLTQHELSRKAGISRNYYSEIERGVKYPSLDVVEKLNKELPLIFFK